MADFQTIMSALRKADAAGDVDGARRLAAMAREVQSQNTPQQDAIKIFDRNVQEVSERNTGAEFFRNPHTGQMTSRELLQNQAPERSNLFSAGLGGAEGGTLGAADELAGGLGYLQGGSDQAQFDRENFRAQSQASRDQNPIAHTLGQVSGAIGTSAGVGVPLAASTSGARAAVAGAGIGVAEGGLFGFNEGEGGFFNRAENAGKTAAIGGALGAAAVPATSALRAAGRTVAAPIAGTLNAITGRGNQTLANRKIAQILQRSGTDAEKLDAIIAQAGREGQSDFVTADALGVSGQRGLAGSARQAGDARQKITDFLNQRQANQGDRVGGFVAEGFDAQNTAQQTQDALRAARTAEADINYNAARGNSQPVDIRGTLAAIDGRIGGIQGSGVVGDGIDAKLSGYRSQLANQTPEKSIELSDFDRVLNLKQSISDDIGAAKRAGRNNEARVLGNIQSQLDAALEQASPQYRQANDTFAQQSGVIDSVETGQGFAKPSVRGGDVVDTFKNLSPEQQGAARTGLGDAFLRKLEGQREGANKAAPFSTQKNAEIIPNIANDPELLSRRLAREDAMFETRRQAIGGSQTADNLSDAEDITPNLGALAQLMAGRPLAAAGEASRGVANFATGQNEATRKLIADALLSKEPSKALSGAIGQSQREITNKRILEALARQGGIQNLN